MGPIDRISTPIQDAVWRKKRDWMMKSPNPKSDINIDSARGKGRIYRLPLQAIKRMSRRDPDSKFDINGRVPGVEGKGLPIIKKIRLLEFFSTTFFLTSLLSFLSSFP